MNHFGNNLSKYRRRAGISQQKLAALQREVDEHKRHKDIYQHTLTVLDQAIALEKDVKGWNAAKGSFRGYQSQADTILAVSQGHIDATVVTNTVAQASIKSGKYKGLVVAGNAPYVTDFVSLAAKRSEFGLINYLNLFVNQQVRNGRYDELWKKWVGDEIKPANLTVPGVYY